ncbi:GlsB/YeaQ/YmgE family stress response membrane protein [Frigidibacter sp. MR17.24]|uniref:GlsB/YeaQ/YmgE family stress response membrane protein n=1 Tax=Frigidibacter sp. MR17.24 TaxID=3127345 RepID=UPI003012A816
MEADGILQAFGVTALVLLAVVGLLAGWFAGLVTGRNRVKFMVLGVIGALVAPVVLALAGVTAVAAAGVVALVLAALVGAAVLLGLGALIFR